MVDRLRNPYTPDEDFKIFLANGRDLAVLAEKLGRTYAALNSRRAKLRRRAGAPPRPRLADLQPLVHRPPPPGPNFARPEFFVSENLTKIALARR